MPRRCTVCTHDHSDEINQALVAREPLRDIARRCRVSKDALARHKENHLPVHLARAKDAKEVAHADNLLDQVNKLRDSAWSILDEAKGAGDLKTALSANREARGCIELLGKLMGEIQGGQAVNILVTTEWTQIRGSIFFALADYPEARIAVGRALKEIDVAGE